MRKYLLLTIYALIISYGNIHSREMLNHEELAKSPVSELFRYEDEMLDYEELAKSPVSELFRYGDEHMKLNHLDTAMGYYIILAGKYDKRMDKADKYLCVQACKIAGQIYYQKEDYSKAFDMYFKAVRIAEENGFGKILANLYINIGNIYGVFEDYHQSINYYKTGLDYARKYDDKTMEMRLLVNLSGICCYENRTAEARVYYDEMMKYVGKDTLLNYFSHLNKALILGNEKKYDSAVIHFEKSAEYACEMKLEPRYTGSVYGELAKLYEQMGKKDSAIHYFRKNVIHTEKYNLSYMLTESLKALARLYEEEGNLTEALHYKSRYFAISDSLFSMEKFNKMKNAQFIYEIDKNYQKITLLTSEKEHKEIQIKTQKRFLIALCAGLFLFIILLIVVYTQKQKLHNAYKDLFSRNSELLQSELQYKELRTKYENKPPEEKPCDGNVEQQAEAFIEKKGLETNTPEEKSEEVKLYSANKLTDKQKEDLIRDINKIMETTDEFCDCDFSLEYLAGLIGSNSRYVSQIINDTYNKNFRAFLNEYRIKEARRRLMDTAHYGNFTIKAIAESVGYKSHTSFVEIFKKTTGITPSIYQKLAKEGK